MTTLWSASAVEPTPLREMRRLSEYLGGPRLLIKRDDLLPFGGAKFRKAVAAASEAKRAGASTVVTEGSVESSHARTLAIAAARTGLRCVLILSPERGNQSAPTLLDEAYGAEVVLVENTDARRAAVRRTMARLKRAHERVMRVPFSGSTPVATLAYVRAFDELIDQVADLDPPTIAAVVVACGTGGMQAGLELGKRRHGSSVKVIGVNAGLDVRTIRRRIARLMDAARALDGDPLPAGSSEILVLDDYRGPGYLQPSDASSEAVELFARLEGIELDPVYTAKAAAGLIDRVRHGLFSPSDTVVYWHSAG